jgi:hypothetical protein
MRHAEPFHYIFERPLNYTKFEYTLYLYILVTILVTILVIFSDIIIIFDTQFSKSLRGCKMNHDIAGMYLEFRFRYIFCFTSIKNLLNATTPAFNMTCKIKNISNIRIKRNTGAW